MRPDQTLGIVTARGDEAGPEQHLWSLASARIAEAPSATAWAYRRRGVQTRTTWAQAGAAVDALAAQLAAEGVDESVTVTVVGFVGPEFMIVLLALAQLGPDVVVWDPTQRQSSFWRRLDADLPAALIVTDREAGATILSAAQNVPEQTKLIVDIDETLAQARIGRDWEQLTGLLDAGAASLRRGAVARRARGPRTAGCVTVCRSDGTADVMTQAELLQLAGSAARSCPRGGGTYLVGGAPGTVLELCAALLPLVAPVDLAFAETSSTLRSDARELRPTMFALSTERLAELGASLTGHLARTGRVRRALLQRGLNRADGVSRLCHFAAARPALRFYGLDRLRFLMTERTTTDPAALQLLNAADATTWVLKSVARHNEEARP